jgi:signal transduction histidine kinase
MQQQPDQNHLYTVGQLTVSNDQVPPETTVSAAYDRFSASPGLEALAIVEGMKPAGLITRTKLLFKLSRRFGYELYAKHSIITVADTAPMVVLADELLDSVIEKACARPPQDVYDEIVVVNGAGNYLGLLSLKELVIQQSIALTRSVLLQEVATARSQELERVNQVKSQFLANVTHELRSPVNAIVGLTQLLKMAAEKGSMAQIQERLAFLMSTAANLRTVITNILDMSKIEAGKMEVAHKEIDVVALLREIMETTCILIRDKPIMVSLTVPADRLEITTDEMKLRQILTNLIGNAAKFTDKGTIEIRLSVGEERLDIGIIDTGIGIRQEDLHVLFSSFGQIEDAATKSREGTGLGLAISKKLAKLLGGSIAVTSTYGKGTEFTVSLPRHLQLRQE